MKFDQFRSFVSRLKSGVTPKTKENLSKAINAPDSYVKRYKINQIGAQQIIGNKSMKEMINAPSKQVMEYRQALGMR